MRIPWGNLQYVFSIQQKEEGVDYDTGNKPKWITYGLHRLDNRSLDKNSVNVLVVDRSAIHKPFQGRETSNWEHLVHSTYPNHQPTIIIEV